MAITHLVVVAPYVSLAHLAHAGRVVLVVSVFVVSSCQNTKRRFIEHIFTPGTHHVFFCILLLHNGVTRVPLFFLHIAGGPFLFLAVFRERQMHTLIKGLVLLYLRYLFLLLLNRVL